MAPVARLLVLEADAANATVAVSQQPALRSIAMRSVRRALTLALSAVEHA
jgi:hypothetical protein